MSVCVCNCVCLSCVCARKQSVELCMSLVVNARGIAGLNTIVDYIFDTRFMGKYVFENPAIFVVWTGRHNIWD